MDRNKAEQIADYWENVFNTSEEEDLISSMHDGELRIIVESQAPGVSSILDELRYTAPQQVKIALLVGMDMGMRITKHREKVALEANELDSLWGED